MLASLYLSPIYDMDAIAAICRDPYVARVGHDDRPCAPIGHPAATYLGAYVDGSLVGCFLLIESGFIEIEVHALLLRRAIAASRALGRLCVEHCFAKPNVQRITAMIIEGLETAVNYVKRIGFTYEGMKRDACRKNGRLVGVHVMGLTRSDWEAA